MKYKRQITEAYLAFLSIILIMLVLASSTYAWFSLQSYTNTEAYTATVDGSGVSLLIANSPDGNFDVECELVYEIEGELDPVSTLDFSEFYTATAQDPLGVSIRFKKTERKPYVHGFVYVTNKSGSCALYLNPETFLLQAEPQVMAGLRLGMKINSFDDDNRILIFKFDEMVNGSVESEKTVEQIPAVISSVTGDGSPVFAKDPAVAISDYMAKDGADGNDMICSMIEKEVVSIEFWLYLEGCDENTLNSVQKQDVAFALGFTGVEMQRGGKE